MGEHDQQKSAGSAGASSNSESLDERGARAAQVDSPSVDEGRNAPAGLGFPSQQTSSVHIMHPARQVQEEPLTFGQVQDSSLVTQGQEATVDGGLAGIHENRSILQVTAAEYEYLKQLVQRDRDMQRQRLQAGEGSNLLESIADNTVLIEPSSASRLTTPHTPSRQEQPFLAFREAFPIAFTANLSPAFNSSEKLEEIITISPDSPAEQVAHTVLAERNSHRKTKLQQQSGSSEEKEAALTSRSAAKPVSSASGGMIKSASSASGGAIKSVSSASGGAVKSAGPASGGAVKSAGSASSGGVKSVPVAGGGAAKPNSASPGASSGAQKAQLAVSKAASATPKRIQSAVTPWSCPNCGSKEQGHDAVLCTIPRRTDITRSIAEEQWLKQLDKLRRDQRRVQYQQMREAAESEEGSEIPSESEEDDEESESEEEGSSYLDDTSSYQPSSVSTSSKSQSQSQSRQLEDRLARIEAILMSGQSALPGLSSVGHTESGASGARYRNQPSAVRFSASPQHTFSESSSKLSQGMLGCPELERREDLLVLSKFEALEKKYADYVDRAQDHDRTPQTMAHCFRKYLPTIVMTLNSLLSRDAAVRRKFSSVFAAEGAYVVTEDMLKAWDAHTFKCMYKELCTAKTFMASEVITQLMDTKFARHPPRGQDPYTLTAFVMQATTAFQERLESMPTQTVKRCSDSQLRDSFVKMILGKDDKHLADFSHCFTWMEAAQSMFDLEGTGQGVNFMRQALQDHVQPSEGLKMSGNHPQRTEDRASDKSGGASDPKQDWSSILRRLSAEIEHSPKDLEGHTSDREKAKRLLSLRDSRRRQQELKGLEHFAANESQSGAVVARQGPARDHLLTRRQGSPVRERQSNLGHDQLRDTGNLRTLAPGGGEGSGHRSQSQLGPSESRQGPRCYNCHGYGHLAKDCPKIGAGGATERVPSRSRDSSTASQTRRSA